MIFFERPKIEPVSPRERRTVASFVEKRARMTSVNGGSILGCMKEDSLVNCTLSVDKAEGTVEWAEGDTHGCDRDGRES
jgi:hypothetical protein